MRNPPIVLLCALIGSGGCMVGPNYAPPKTRTAESWIGAAESGVRTEPASVERWWEVFRDPTLTHLVEIAYDQNLSLRSAGLRVLQAQARRRIAIGNLFPQQQELTGSFTHNVRSKNAFGGASGGIASVPREFDSWMAGFDAAWELDLWGRFRRAIEAADADLLGSIASYDDVLVSLVSEVAATYVRIRALQERIAVARNNVKVQSDSLAIASVRFEAGGTSDLDVQQAATLLHDTEATIPALQIQLQQAQDSLSVLLGAAPADLTNLLGPPGAVPTPPASVAIGIPAELLRRRPDVRRAEQAAAAQSARIGVAVADLLPTFQLTGSIGFSAEDAEKLFEGKSFEAMGGPAFRWPVLNYGRIVNNVRLQDATFQQLAVDYENAVLNAQRDVQDAIVGYLRGLEQVQRLSESVEAANRAVDLSLIQYREGAADYTSVLNAQQSKLREDDLLATTRGSVVLSVVGLYKALGGGWEIRNDRPFVPDEVRREMDSRSWLGLTPVAAGPAATKPWRGQWWWSEE